MINDQFGVNGQTVEYAIHSAKVLGADRGNDQILTLSADLSAYQMTIAPLGVSATGMLVFINTDQPVDIRTNAASDTTFLSAVTLLALAGSISNIYITTGSQATTVWQKVAGGSNATTQTTFPLP